MYEVIGSLIGLVALYHLFGCGNPVSLFSPGSATGSQSQQANQVVDQTKAVGQAAQGQTLQQQQDAQAQIQPLLDTLVSQGMTAQDAQAIQVSVANMSQGDVATAAQQLTDLGNSVQQGLIKPGDLSTVGGIIATAVQKQYQTGQQMNFGNVMNDITTQMQTALPQYQSTANQAAPVASQITAQTGALGNLNQQQFNQAFQPALMALNQQYTNDSRTLDETMAGRGLTEQGSMAGTGTDAQGNFEMNPQISSESTPQNNARLMLAQQHDQDLAAATLAAQQQANQQQVSNLTAAQQTPGALGTAVQTQASPLAALSTQTAADANTNLALQSSRAADISSLTNTGTGAVNTSVSGAQTQAGAQQAKLANDVTQTQSTVAPALAQLSTPQSDRLGYAAGVTPGVSNALSGLGSSAIGAQQANQAVSSGAFMSLSGAGAASSA